MYLIFLNCDNIIFIKLLSSTEKSLKDTHGDNTPSDKAQTLTKSLNMDICVMGHQINYL